MTDLERMDKAIQASYYPPMWAPYYGLWTPLQRGLARVERERLLRIRAGMVERMERDGEKAA
jgi:hypothetical protein